MACDRHEDALATEDPALREKREQLREVMRVAPIICAVHSINALILALTFLDAAPAPLVAGPLALLLAGFGLRSLLLLRQSGREIPLSAIRRRIVVLNAVTGTFVLALASWSAALASYGTPAQVLVAVIHDCATIAICTVSLLHLRSAALTALSVLVPVGLVKLATAVAPVQAGMMICAISGGGLLYLTVLSSARFRQLVRQLGDLKRLNRDTERLARVDLLTGLPNRRSFFSDLDAIVAASPPDAEIHLAVIDIDGFKTVNEMYGHAIGDAALAEISMRIGEFCGERHRLGRLGGDEFGLVVAGAESAHDAFDLCCRIGEALRQPLHLAERTIRVSASIGFASARASSRDVAHLHEQVHYALREAKLDRRAGCMRFSPAQEARMRRANAVAQALRNADFQRELRLEFQPVIDADRNGIIAFEALARWNSPEIGRVSPVEFITAAESAGLIGLMTDVLLVKALAAAAQWPERVHLYVNLSAHDIMMPDFAARAAEIIRASGVAPGRIAFEVTETAIIRDFAAAKDTLDALKALGVAVALDDFGTGFSSLSYIHRLPIDKLKIDRSFTSEILTNPACRDIVRSVSGLCRKLGIDCVAEGVETQAQMALLGRLGCRSMQGYFFSRPLPAEEAAALACARGAAGDADTRAVSAA